MESGLTSPFSCHWQLLPKTHVKGDEVKLSQNVLSNSLQKQFCLELCHLLAPEQRNSWNPLYRKYRSWSGVVATLIPGYTVRL